MLCNISFTNNALYQTNAVQSLYKGHLHAKPFDWGTKDLITTQVKRFN